MKGGRKMDQTWAKETMEKIMNKVEKNCAAIGAGFPHACKDDVYDDMHPSWWTNGFWPGMLWMAYQQSGDKKYAETAAEVEKKLDVVLDEFWRVDHDAGFIWLLSAGAQYRILKTEESKTRCMKAASFLASRFNLAGNFIQAWNSQNGWAIIDCCMNLPLLYWASEVTGNPRFGQIAKAHANTALEYFVRPDGSVNHVLSFDPETGEFIESIQGQAASPTSAWSRGTAWAVYGLALSYRHTGEQKFLDGAKKVASFFLANLPEDYVAHWDFRVERKADTPRDTSASACTACGLLELAEHVPDCEKEVYRKAAVRMLQSLADHYSNLDNDKQCILREGTGHCTANQNVNVGLIYGDYFFMEAVSRLLGNRDIFWYEP